MKKKKKNNFQTHIRQGYPFYGYAFFLTTSQNSFTWTSGYDTSIAINKAKKKKKSWGLIRTIHLHYDSALYLFADCSVVTN